MNEINDCISCFLAEGTFYFVGSISIKILLTKSNIFTGINICMKTKVILLGLGGGMKICQESSFIKTFLF